ncbi:hypothetical protein POX_g08843 [Penicillium oxalicum]|uniref:WSC domain-containing protein n=1 Tax=Penicillium oxalicum (strain 114-2 / CGMCC 5302) TaxID=933388 RepID=S7ZDW5_PENO1|nr:hypothetical protein POX_g08843 [Penicillium oxalicum]EPS26856.1 hypothetical protein PDE_01796 [Penicillium oxalicum 114-2]KAI2786457.1 hypothetical protein POX_g08843 [Penicillium oxalicum]
MYTSQVLATLALAMPALVSASTLYPTMGCYSDVPDLKNMTTNVYNSYGFCTDHCRQGNYKFAVVSQGDHCACSNAVPPPSFKIDDEKCKIVCPGFPEDFCGSNVSFNVLSVKDSSDFVSSVTSAQAAATASGGIVVAASTSTPLTASMATTTDATWSSASSTASATPTFNAASSMREGSSLAGVLLAGLTFLL